jgi:hypothetical protein
MKYPAIIASELPSATPQFAVSTPTISATDFITTECIFPNNAPTVLENKEEKNDKRINIKYKTKEKTSKYAPILRSIKKVSHTPKSLHDSIVKDVRKNNDISISVKAVKSSLNILYACAKFLAFTLISIYGINYNL